MMRAGGKPQVKLKITVDGKAYEVEVEAEETEVVHAAATHRPLSWTPAPAAPVTAASAPGAAPVADESKVCRTPMVGVVSRITAREGQEVKVDDALLVLEAMKMETSITSPVAGKIKKINVSAGESVQAGQVLIEFE